MNEEAIKALLSALQGGGTADTSGAMLQALSSLLQAQGRQNVRKEEGESEKKPSKKASAPPQALLPIARIASRDTVYLLNGYFYSLLKR